jgi:DNA-binding XRE family transcriptional regulator
LEYHRVSPTVSRRGHGTERGLLTSPDFVAKPTRQAGGRDLQHSRRGFVRGRGRPRASERIADSVRAELHDGDEAALAAERARTEAWAHAFHLAEERRRVGLTQRDVAQAMGVTPGRVSQIENGDLDVNEVSTLGRYAQALGAKLRIMFDYGAEMRQIS